MNKYWNLIPLVLIFTTVSAQAFEHPSCRLKIKNIIDAPRFFQSTLGGIKDVHPQTNQPSYLREVTIALRNKGYVVLSPDAPEKPSDMSLEVNIPKTIIQDYSSQCASVIQMSIEETVNEGGSPVAAGRSDPQSLWAFSSTFSNSQYCKQNAYNVDFFDAYTIDPQHGWYQFDAVKHSLQAISRLPKCQKTTDRRSQARIEETQKRWVCVLTEASTFRRVINFGETLESTWNAAVNQCNPNSYGTRHSIGDSPQASCASYEDKTHDTWTCTLTEASTFRKVTTFGESLEEAWNKATNQCNPNAAGTRFSIGDAPLSSCRKM